MNEAILKTDFDRQERGLPPIPKVKVVREEPERPIVPDEITFADIPQGEIFEFSARLRHPTIRNEAGMLFTGYDTYVECRDGTVKQGWMIEGQFQLLKQRLQVERPDLLSKIGL